MVASLDLTETVQMHLYDTCMLCVNEYSQTPTCYCMEGTDQLHCSYTANCLQMVVIPLPLHLHDHIKIKHYALTLTQLRNNSVNITLYMYSPKSNVSSEIGSKVLFRIPGQLFAAVRGKECSVLSVEIKFTIMYMYSVHVYSVQLCTITYQLIY